MNHTISTRSYKETSDLIASLFDGQAISFAQTDVIIQELLKRDLVSVFDYLNFAVKEQKAFKEANETELNIIRGLLRDTLRAVEARL